MILYLALTARDVIENYVSLKKSKYKSVANFVFPFCLLFVVSLFFFFRLRGSRELPSKIIITIIIKKRSVPVKQVLPPNKCKEQQPECMYVCSSFPLLRWVPSVEL